ncbi:MAG: ribokinase [Clostridia bacterium]|nr:ribokinase [Clostridia bacterium]
MKKYETAIIGHVSEDINTDFEGNTVRILGGAVIYASAAAFALGHAVAAITKIVPDDRARRNAFILPPEDIYIRSAARSTSIENRYLTADKERRICRCISQGDAFRIADLPAEISARVFHFAGLIYGDFPDELIKYCAGKGDIALDVQTCLRHANKETGEMFFNDWSVKREMLPYVRYLKTDAAEAEILTGTGDRYEAAKILHSFGAQEILITHNTEVLAYDGEKMYTCPIRARNLSGRTGRGDTTFSAYINERLSSDIPAALLTATALVSLKMETPGQYRGTRADLDAYIAELYPDHPVILR